MPTRENVSGAYVAKRPRPGHTVVTTGGPGGVPKVKLDKPKADFPHLKGEAALLASLSPRDRKRYLAKKKGKARR